MKHIAIDLGGRESQICDSLPPSGVSTSLPGVGISGVGWKLDMVRRQGESHADRRRHPATLPEFEERFGTEEQCEALLMKLRWPDGFVCP